MKVSHPDSLVQAWTNVLMNAIQAVEGKCMITITLEELPQARDKIFEAFYTTKQRGYGTGLGLNISKQIVEQHAGRLVLKVRMEKPFLPYPI